MPTDNTFINANMQTPHLVFVSDLTKSALLSADLAGHFAVLVRFRLQAISTECFGGPDDRADAKNVAIVITDGVPYPATRRQPAIDVAERLRMEDREYRTPGGAVVLALSSTRL